MSGLYQFLYQDIGLPVAGVLLGLSLVALHGAAYLKRDPAIKILTDFPRNRQAGIIILILCTLWSLFLVAEMDLGEFYTMRNFAILLLPVGCYLIIKYVPEFLSVRALGTLLLLLAGPVLQAAFLEPPFSRLLLPILAYVWILVGMFWIGMPYLMRDWIDWVLAGGTKRWNQLCFAGVAYGALTAGCAVFLWT